MIVAFSDWMKFDSMGYVALRIVVVVKVDVDNFGFLKSWPLFCPCS